MNDENIFIKLSKDKRPTLPVELWRFLSKNKKWWMIPIIIVLLLLGILIVFSSSVLAPFIYPLI